MRNDEILCCSRLGSLVDSTCRPWQIMVSSSRSSSSFRCGRNAWNKNEQTTSWRICQICSSKSIKSSIQWMCFQIHILQTFKEASASVWLSPWRPHAAMDSPSACASHLGEWGKSSIPALWQVTQVTNKKLPPAASSYAANVSPSKRLSFWPRQQLQEQHKSQTSSEAAAKKTKKNGLSVFRSFQCFRGESLARLERSVPAMILELVEAKHQQQHPPQCRCNWICQIKVDRDTSCYL